MKLTFKTQPQATEWGPLEAIWRAADQIPELTGGWLFDHFYPILTEDPAGPCFEGWTALAYLAGVTQRLRLGLMVAGNSYRHPAVLANMIATLDVASGGRVEVGLGAGWNAEEHEAYGIPLLPAAARIAALDEACQVLDLLLTEPLANFEGEHYRLRDARCEPKPVQKPRPPLVVGGAGEQRTLRVVAKYADHWNFPGRTADELRHKLRVLHRHCSEVGRDPDDIEVSAHLFEPLHPARSAALAADMKAAGCDHLILYLESPFDVSKLETITRAVAEAVL